MATTAEEMEQYQAMDQIRAAQEAEMARKKGLRRWQRLMPADEVTGSHAASSGVSQGNQPLYSSVPSIRQSITWLGLGHEG